MRGREEPQSAAAGGLAGWLLDRFARPRRRSGPRLELVARIALGPRQSLALIDAEGTRLLVATSAEGSPAFYRLHGRPAGADRRAAGRISW